MIHRSNGHPTTKAVVLQLIILFPILPLHANNITDPQCVASYNFGDIGDSIWTQYTLYVDRPAYGVEYNDTIDSYEFHLFWFNNSNSSNWIIGYELGYNNWSTDALYSCSKYALSDCIAGEWDGANNGITTVMTDCDCVPTVYTVNFGGGLDGVWYYDFENEYYNLNDSWQFTLRHIWLVGGWDYWYIYNLWSWSAYCANYINLPDCTGRWYFDDEASGNGYYPHSEAVSLLLDCSYAECGGIINEEDANC